MKNSRVARSALLAALASFGLQASAEPETFTIDPQHTFPSFELMHFNVSMQRGRFNKTTGKITVDTEARTGSADVTIEANTVDTGLPRIVNHLRSADFFDVEKFPTLVFKGNTFTFDGEKVKTVAGELTILGVARPVTITAVTYNCAPHPVNKKKVCGGDFITTIKRSDWGMTRGIPVISDEVTLRVNVEAIKD